MHLQKIEKNTYKIFDKKLPQSSLVLWIGRLKAIYLIHSTTVIWILRGAKLQLFKPRALALYNYIITEK